MSLLLCRIGCCMLAVQPHSAITFAPRADPGYDRVQGHGEAGMAKYSIFSLVKNALSHHQNWDRAWRDNRPKDGYDVIIIGGGGHGLATAYYLAKEHGITNVAVLEKGWLGGGNTGRNTTII